MTQGNGRVRDNIDDELLSPEDIDIKMAPKLLKLQFPRIDEGMYNNSWIYM